jgi:hypothetical protein
MNTQQAFDWINDKIEHVNTVLWTYPDEYLDPDKTHRPVALAATLNEVTQELDKLRAYVQEIEKELEYMKQAERDRIWEEENNPFY